MSSSIYNFDKAQQSIRLINIPSMFFGSAIEKGSVELRMIRTSPATLPPGTLSSSLNTPPPDGKSIAILRDSKLDGTLIQTYDSDLVEKTSTNDNKVAGMVLYNQGIILLTGSWQLTRFTGSGGYSHPFGNAEPAWINFGDRNTDDEYLCYLSFRGTTRTPVRTVFANAPVNELNHSNNPTYLSYGQTFSYGTYSGSILLPAVDSFVESSNIKVANTHGDSYSEEVLTLDNLSPSGSNFVKQTYLSKVILYDDNKIPIAVVKLSSPLRKREKDSLSVKVLLDL
jgi:hypothetical protein